ncbi:MAG TPA: TIGR03936 family radical SAM-associated protein [Caproiciproducens sp.]|nr:TIGR03936 family radical SAM-associated protein [Caproiciproducens sp.]
MKAVRIWFKKIGTARYISHLDLSRCMSRAFHKAKIPLWYTQGFSPHAFLTFALPLALGISSERESMDVKLNDDKILNEELLDKLNDSLPPDLAVYQVTEPKMKPGQIAEASYRMIFDTEGGDTQNIAAQMRALFQGTEVIVPKHTKNGMIDLDLKPYLDRTQVSAEHGDAVVVHTVLPAGSTMNVNPMLLNDAVKKYLNMDLYVNIERINLFDTNHKIFE